MEYAPITYLDDFLATNMKKMERDIVDARERFSVNTSSTDVPPILRGLSHEEWGLARSIIEETLRCSGRLTDGIKIPLLYLEAGSWDTIFWVIEHSWREELELEEVLVQSYREELEGTILRTLPYMLPPHRLQELALQHEQRVGKIQDVSKLFREIQRIREEAGRRAEAITAWCEASLGK